jgi:two-component system, OmpR family, sensor kinase
VSIRLRLALYYGALFAVILLLVLLLGYAIHARGEYDDLDSWSCWRSGERTPVGL